MAAAVDDRTLRLTRRFDASPERLFDAWTDQKQFAEWFGPKGVTTVYCDLDPRTGGAWRLLGRNTERSFAVSGRYLEVKRPERLAFTFAWRQGRSCRAARARDDGDARLQAPTRRQDRDEHGPDALPRPDRDRQSQPRLG